VSRTLSAHGAAVIAEHEGKVNTLYDDPAGHCTIGIGHLVHRGSCDGSEPEAFRRGLSDQEVYDLFIADAGRFIEAVNDLVTVPLNQNQFDALVSFAFNVGIGALEGSTLRQKLNRGDYAGAAQEFAKWVKADRRTLPGLVNRRAAEARLFLTPDDDQEAPVAGLDHLHPVFAQRVANACRARGTSVYSGARSTERQRQLYEDFLAGRGNPANPPGTSWHEHGEGIPGGHYALAVDFAEPYPHGEPGLVFPIKGEPWHAQPAEIPEPARVAGAENRLRGPTPKEDQLFSLSPISATHIIASHSGLLLTAGEARHGAPVVQKPADGSLNQRWQIVGHSDGTVSYVCRAGDLALDRPDGATEKGTVLQVAGTDYNPNQRWTVDGIASYLGRLYAPGTNRCVDITGASSLPGAHAQLWVAQPDYRWQQFVFAPTL
jgi:GH24 family phage-related lysozyme (muramidase)